MDTGIANAMKLAAEDQTTLDEHVTNLFSHKSILAILMKYCVREFQGLSADFIAENCIVGSPVIRKMAVDRDVPDMDELPIEFQGLEEESAAEEEKLREPEGIVSYDAIMLDGNERIQGLNTVDKTQKEGTAIYDIIFLARAPKTNDIIQLIINIEVQNDQWLKYYVETRGIYYCARMISAQKNRVFKHSDYQKIRKVYSIWICPYAKNGKNTVTTYSVDAKNVYGDAAIPREAYDKLELVVVTLNAKGLESENELIKYLSLLLNVEMPLDEREKKLETEYHLQMTEEIKEEAGKVCNYGETIARRAAEQVENNLNQLYLKLSEAGRLDEFDRCMRDDDYKEKMYVKLNIKPAKYE